MSRGWRAARDRATAVGAAGSDRGRGGTGGKQSKNHHAGAHHGDNLSPHRPSDNHLSAFRAERFRHRMGPGRSMNTRESIIGMACLAAAACSNSDKGSGNVYLELKNVASPTS